MTPMERQALAYVRNTGGGATKAHFEEDHEPVGPKLWLALLVAGLVRTDEAGKIHVTDAGAEALTSANSV